MVFINLGEVMKSKILLMFVGIGVVLVTINMKRPTGEFQTSGMGQKEFETIIKSTKATLASDIISPEVLKSIVQKNLLIENLGTELQQQEARAMIKNNHSHLMRHINTAIETFIFDPEFRKIVGNIAITALVGAMPALVLSSLKLASGQLDQGDLLAAGEQAALYSAVLEMIHHLTEQVSASKVKDVMIAQSLNQIKSDASFWVIPAAGVKSWMSKEISSLVTESIGRQGGVSTILKKLDWKEFVVGQPVNAFPNEYRMPIDYLSDAMRRIIKDKKNRQLLGTIVLTAAEGALIGALLWSMGIWVVAEGTLLIAMENAALRGAVQGLMNHFVSGTASPGALQNISSGLLVQDLQNKLILSTQGIGLTEVVPVVMKEVVVSAVQTTINQMGGWSNTIGTIVTEAKKSVVSQWSWIGGAIKQKFTSALDWVQRDLERGFSFHEGVL
jgi:hypothetical protein